MNPFSVEDIKQVTEVISLLHLSAQMKRAPISLLEMVFHESTRRHPLIVYGQKLEANEVCH